ncbi:hypothetical protein ES705_29034 [subsurface metagenome]
MPLKSEVSHHSISDWDFEDGDEYRELSTAQFVSPPTSLLYAGDGHGVNTRILCRIPATLVLPQGEMRSWVYPSNSFFRLFMFRNQAVLGTANFLNCYSLTIYANVARFSRWLVGVETIVDVTACHYFLNEWTRYRIVWYTGMSPREVEAICLDLYYEVAGEWVKEGETMYHDDNLWVDEPVNRCGLTVYVLPANLIYFDDTEIWGPL